MSIDLSELQDSAQKAFPASTILPPRDDSWKLVAEMGWLLVDLPEELGGLGLSREAAMQACEKLSRGRSACVVLSPDAQL